MNTNDRPTRILMVCTGNICRSTMAHAVLEQAAARAGVDVIVDSAGVSDEEQGNPIDHRARRVLRDAGYDPDGHRARKIRPEYVRETDLFVVAEDSHRNWLRQMIPEADIRLVTDFIPGRPPGDPMIDPWYGPDEGFTDTLADAEAAMPALLAQVRRRIGSPQAGDG